YCLEGADNTPELMKLVLPDSTTLTSAFAADKLNGVVTITGNALLPLGTKSKSVAITAIPYYAWNNRGANEMKVWIPVKQ
ncbi:MAG: glycoside hydrolase family 127 protein, partial [Candidatus Saccharibacteria bacterium]